MAVQHIALIRFKPGTTAAVVEDTFARLRQLRATIPGIMALTSGPNTSPEGLAQDHTHGFVMTFQDTPARDAYITHPEHQKFVQFAGPLFEKITVFDYEG